LVNGVIRTLTSATIKLRHYPLGQQLHVFQVSSESQIDNVFAPLANLRPDALVVSASGFLGARNNQLIELGRVLINSSGVDHSGTARLDGPEALTSRTKPYEFYGLLPDSSPAPLACDATPSAGAR
jgi:hypothetical protein